MGVWGEAKSLHEAFNERERKRAMDSLREGQMNSPHAVEWRRRVLAEGLGTTDDVLPPRPTQKTPPAP